MVIKGEEKMTLEHFNNLHLFDDAQTVPFCDTVYNLEIGDVIDAKEPNGRYYENWKIINFSKCWKERPETEEEKQNFKIVYLAIPPKNSYLYEDDYYKNGITIAPNWIYKINKGDK